MRPETLQNELQKILETSFLRCGYVRDEPDDDESDVCLSETEMFQLWNLLGEELGIDLSLLTPEQRDLLFAEVQNGRKISPKEFSSLLWLVYYAN